MECIRPLTSPPGNHFFGYYGITPWDRGQRYHLALETDFHEHRPQADDVASVGLVDLEAGEFFPKGQTSAFNLQQGTMLHWIDAGYGEEFTFNDWERDRLVSRALNPETGDCRTINGAIAAVSPARPEAIGLSFGRMAHCRPVVGYASGADPADIVARPEDDGLFLLDLSTGESRLLISIAEVVRAARGEEVPEGAAWFNHVLFNTDGTRLLFFSRVLDESRFRSSLWTIRSDGSELECQIGFRYTISHFDWIDADRILISTDVLGQGMQFVEFTVGQGDFAPFGDGQLPSDGHASLSPDRRWLVCDTYPMGPERLSDLMLYDVRRRAKVTLGKLHSPEPFRGDIRCDLHPRWSRDAKTVSFDSIHEGSRQIYLADISGLVTQEELPT